MPVVPQKLFGLDGCVKAPGAAKARCLSLFRGIGPKMLAKREKNNPGKPQVNVYGVTAELPGWKAL